MAWTQDHLRVLKKNRLHMVKNIDLANSELWDALVAREVVSSTQRENIEGRNPSNNKQVSALVTHLEKRPTTDFYEFLMALQETDQQTMAEHLAGQIGYVIPSEDPDKGKLSKAAISQPSEQPTRNAVQVQDIAEGVRDVHIRNIRPCTREFYENVKHKSYDLRGLDKGCVLIVNVTKDRIGCEVDKHTMKDLFEDLGFNVKILTDPNYLQLESELISFATSEQNQTAKSVFVVMMAHGGIKKRQGSRPFIKLADDSTFYFKDQLDDLFSSQKAPHLIKKPKVFIIQACMGEALDEGTIVTTFGNPVRQTVEFDDVGNQNTRDMTCTPKIFDCLYAFATIPDYKAVRDTIDGSLFLNEINLVFRAEAHDTHVSDMLVTVRSNVAEKTGRMAAERIAEEQLLEKTTGEQPARTKEVFVQTTHNVDLLSKRIYFFPGI